MQDYPLSPEDIQRQELIEHLYSNKYVSISNALAQARQKTSLFESKLELLAIYRMNERMKTREKIDGDGKPYNVHYVEIQASEIQQLSGRKKTSGSLYTQVAAAAVELKSKLYIYKDDKENSFHMDNLYGAVDYYDGKLTIEFNPATENLFLDLKDNFTKIMLNIAFKFSTNGGFQLYKLLKSKVYSLNPINDKLPQSEQDYMLYSTTLSELRLQLGYVDLNQPDIKKEGAKSNPDSDKISALDKKPKYKRWSDFYDKVLAPGMKEVNEISDIYIESIEKTTSSHGKIDGLIIKVSNNKDFYLRSKNKKKKIEEPIKEKKFLSDEEIDDFIDELRNDIPVALKTRELKQIAESAEYNKERIVKAVNVLQKSSHVDNVVGFLIAAITGNYDIPIEKKAQNRFTNFEQRQYTTEQLRQLEELLTKH